MNNKNGNYTQYILHRFSLYRNSPNRVTIRCTVAETSDLRVRFGISAFKLTVDDPEMRVRVSCSTG